MGSLSRAYDALIDAAIPLDKSVQQAPHEMFDNALRAYVKECEVLTWARIYETIERLRERHIERGDNRAALVCDVIEYAIQPLQGETE